MHAVVPIEEGRTFLHVINFYGQTGARSSKALKTKNNSWIETIFELTATIGHDAAIIIGGDFNDDIFLNPIINNAIESRIWTHPRLTYSDSKPCNQLPTYSKHGEWDNPDKEKPSNLDTILVTSSFARTLCDSTVHRDLRLSTHCAVSCLSLIHI